MARDEPVQQRPAPGIELTEFPSKVVCQGSLWHRAHRQVHSPWFYASGGHGRFDLPPPWGTCYLATTAETATREVIGPDFIATGIVPDSLLSGRVVSEVLLPGSVTAAHLTSSTVFRYGISNELCTTTDYPVAQLWARALHGAGFEGVRYQPRFSPGPSRALALFGRAGAHEGLPLRQTPLSSVVSGMAGITVAQTSRRDEYEILDEPL